MKNWANNIPSLRTATEIKLRTDSVWEKSRVFSKPAASKYAIQHNFQKFQVY